MYFRAANTALRIRNKRNVYNVKSKFQKKINNKKSKRNTMNKNNAASPSTTALAFALASGLTPSVGTLSALSAKSELSARGFNALRTNRRRIAHSKASSLESAISASSFESASNNNNNNNNARNNKNTNASVDMADSTCTGSGSGSLSESSDGCGDSADASVNTTTTTTTTTNRHVSTQTTVTQRTASTTVTPTADFTNTNNINISNTTTNRVHLSENFSLEVPVDTASIAYMQRVVSSNEEAGLVVTWFDPFRDYRRMQLSESARRIRDCPNAGGSSVESEVLSFEVINRCFGATLHKTEMEVRYFPHGGSITDYTCRMFGSLVGVSVTRAMNFNRAFTLDDAHKLLSKKLNGIVNANLNSLENWSKQILHVWCSSEEHVRTLVEAYPLLPAATRANTVVVFTIAKADWLFVNPDNRKALAQFARSTAATVAACALGSPATTRTQVRAQLRTTVVQFQQSMCGPMPSIRVM
ncbi:hypothetical protein CAOG_08159 [Capsaspora owczarzaki ATCC 30864]|uniref:Uncharacterized protein n=1 Tax=Capsaspora owczarzaki (strain ATCC 30864) TaxID=595528 RepID=A0A0D2X5P1_CAPO3|nr:hypothetical protein CAOG_08159 [Capsaspora owczarzaki ATCC 30864]KJE98149.1 hypothetical protein CAOG_008159 [Capsaspora owczarzaki ATCC 30864]|eukprot:XP_004342760.1 hypothetical protein CAOG_08159 [Capsaspora owczarzaki ATCC 30864]